MPPPRPEPGARLVAAAAPPQPDVYRRRRVRDDGLLWQLRDQVRLFERYAPATGLGFTPISITGASDAVEAKAAADDRRRSTAAAASHVDQDAHRVIGGGFRWHKGPDTPSADAISHQTGARRTSAFGRSPRQPAASSSVASASLAAPGVAEQGDLTCWSYASPRRRAAPSGVPRMPAVPEHGAEQQQQQGMLGTPRTRFDSGSVAIGTPRDAIETADLDGMCRIPVFRGDRNMLLPVHEYEALAAERAKIMTYIFQRKFTQQRLYYEHLLQGKDNEARSHRARAASHASQVSGPDEHVAAMHARATKLAQQVRVLRDQLKRTEGLLKTSRQRHRDLLESMTPMKRKLEQAKQRVPFASPEPLQRAQSLDLRNIARDGDARDGAVSADPTRAVQLGLAQQREIMQLQRRADDLDAELRDARQLIASMRDDYASARRRVSELEHELARMAPQAELEQQNNALLDMVRVLEKQLSIARSEAQRPATRERATNTAPDALLLDLDATMNRNVERLSNEQLADVIAVLGDLSKLQQVLQVDMTCASCLNPLEDAHMILPCCHTVCRRCIDAGMRRYGCAQCDECGDQAGSSAVPNTLLETVAFRVGMAQPTFARVNDTLARLTGRRDASRAASAFASSPSESTPTPPAPTPPSMVSEPGKSGKAASGTGSPHTRPARRASSLRAPPSRRS